MFHFPWSALKAVYAKSLRIAQSAMRNFNNQETITKQYPIIKIQYSNVFVLKLKIVVWNLFVSCFLRFDYSHHTLCDAQGLSHSEISGSKVAGHLPGAYRRQTTSFIAFFSLGIHRTPLSRISLEILGTACSFTSQSCVSSTEDYEGFSVFYNSRSFRRKGGIPASCPVKTH